MGRSEYYEEMKALARQVRLAHSINSYRVRRSDLRRIYRALGIRIDLWPHKLKGVRGAYFNDEIGPTVLLKKSLPEDPIVFTMAHELKHHLADHEMSYCSTDNAGEMIEIGAEVFAAEFIFPEKDFVEVLQSTGVTPAAFAPAALVKLKRETGTTLSYAGLAKRAEWTGFAKPGSLEGVLWRKEEEQIYGEPLYRVLLRRRRAGGA